MPDDLKHWTAPTFWRLHRDKVWASIFLVCLVVVSFAPNNAERQVSTGHQASYPNRTMAGLSVSAPHDCLKLRKGKWLRWQIAHKGKDAEPWRDIECRYD